MRLDLRIVLPLFAVATTGCIGTLSSSGNGDSPLGPSAGVADGGDSDADGPDSDTGGGDPGSGTDPGGGDPGGGTDPGDGASSGDSGVGTDPAGGDTSGGQTPTCGTTLACDDFEAATAGGPPDTALWSVVTPDCSGDGAIEVDDTVAHSGSRSVRVESAGGFCNHVFFADEKVVASLGSLVHVRFYVRFAEALGGGHVTFAALADLVDGTDLRMGGQNEILMWNRETDDATLPELSPTGVAASVAPAALEWTCIEFAIDQEAGTLQTWVNDVAVTGLTIDGTSTPDIDAQWLRRSDWRPDLTDLKLGWESYSGQAMTLWFDDVAIGTQRVGCD